MFKNRLVLAVLVLVAWDAAAFVPKERLKPAVLRELWARHAPSR